jgi:ligand-binding sensor domain-containing protein
MAGKISHHVLGWGLWLFVLLSGTLEQAFAQQHPLNMEFSHIREQDGLSFRVVTSLLHDRDGFLWVGTNNGLNRYDGTHFVQFRQQRSNSNSLLNNQVYALCEDRQGHIWMGTENGISRYDKTTGHFQHIIIVGNRPLGICKNVLCDRAGNVWFTSRNRGLFRYVTKTGTVQYFPGEATDSTGGIRTLPNGLVEDPHHAGLWMSERSGLRYFDITRRQFTTSRLNPRQLPVFTPNWTSALAVDGDRLLIADNIDRSIVVYDLRQERIIRRLAPATRPERTNFEIATIFVDRKHNLWVSSWSAKTFFIDAQTDRITELGYDRTRPTSLGANSFMAGWQHPDGSVWLGTVNGIAHTNSERALYDVFDLETRLSAGIDQNSINRAFAEDPDGSWWLGTSLRGLLHFVPTTNRLDVYRLPSRTAEYPWGGAITGLSQRGNELFVATGYAIYRFNKQTHQFGEIRLPPAAKSVNLRTFRLQGNQYWAFGDGKRAFAYDITRRQWQTYPIRSVSQDPQFLVRQTLIDRRGQFWLDIYPEGFARWSPQQRCFLVTDPRQADYDIFLNEVVEDRDGSFLMATTMHGLMSYDPVSRSDSIRPENEAMTLSQCTAVLPDRFGNTWVANYNNVSVITPKKQVVNLRIPLNEHTISYNTHLFTLRNGHILSVQKEHLVEFKPENLRPLRTPDPVLLNRILVNDSILLLPGHAPAVPIHLKAEDNSFMIEFSSLSSITDDRYLCKLEGYDEVWQESNYQSEAVYTKLPGGDYVFAVKAVAGEKQTGETKLAIHIDTIFYNTGWFRAALIVLALVLAYGLYQYRVQQTARLHHFQIQMTRLERDKAAIQYQNLINHLNPHFLFNSLTSLNSLILTRPKDASLFLRKLSVIYRYILQNKNSELVSLHDELTFAQNYIDLQKARFGDGLQISVEVAPNFLDRQIVPVTVQNLLENAIKHNSIADDDPLVIEIYTEADSLWVVNTLQRKNFVETSNQQGLNSLKSLYRYLSHREVSVSETTTHFRVSIPLL